MKLSEKLRVKPGKKVKLADHDPDDTAGLKKKEAEKRFEANMERLARLQYTLYADNRYALLVVLQAMDAGGKDSTIRHVFSGVNPQGCKVTSFKVPSPEELEHDFLWRIHKAVPRRGEIGVFNRSHYEDVLVVRVHNLVPKAVWSRRYRQINRFEASLAESNVQILKFYLHISKQEQRERFQDRIDKAHKRWKVNPRDFEERRLWDDYMAAYEAALSQCSTAHAPWFIIPANRKWFRDLAVSQVLVEALEGLDLRFPEPPCDLATLVLE